MKRETNDLTVNGNEIHGDSMLGDLFYEELKDLYSSEFCITETLRVMKMASSSGELVAAFEACYEQTVDHISKLEQVFEMLECELKKGKCEAMEGLKKEAERLISETEDGTATRDTALIAVVQKIVHFEIAAYGCLQQVAISQGYENAALILQTVLQEKKESDKIFTFVTETHIKYEPVVEE
jgi:ferritin-like metal-binding protein YciE